jgi:hypothetical protein
MHYLTQQQRMVLTTLVGLLLTGWAVRAWRQSHPAPGTGAPSEAAATGLRQEP